MRASHRAVSKPWAVGLAVLALFAPRAARASESFPEAIQGALGMSCAPPCTICHDSLSGGYGTVNKPFGIAMFDVGGLTPKQPETVAPALAALEGGGGAAGSAGTAGAPDAGADAGATGGSGGAGGTPGVVDSDGDGVGDVAELRQERDPNVPGAGVVCGPTYGCFARVEPRGRIDGVALSAALAVAGALILFGRRRRT